MANDLNHCSFIGRLGREPETRYMPDGGAITNISLACGWKGKDKEGTEWVRLVAFGKLAEICGEHLKKGAQIFASGRLQTRKWQDKEGNDKYTTEVVMERMQMLGSRPKDGEREAPETEVVDKSTGEVKAGGAAKTGGKFDDFEDDIPF